MNRRIRIQVGGRVQGVGFRPAVYRLATALGLSGFVKNTLAGVEIEAEGAAPLVAQFIERLQAAPPAQARIDSLLTEDLPASNNGGVFEIAVSGRSGDLRAGLPPDLATCAECRTELFDPSNRRHCYPFTNCTNCGPRFTIIRSLPYDRPRTAMSAFELCPECRAEYQNPANRRFDAQPNACPVCGPRLKLILKNGATVAGDPLRGAADMLKSGSILAIKGIGGYHLCCDATSSRAVGLLRARKHRPHKALAVMFAGLEEIRRYCEVSEREKRELLSCAAPVVVLRRKTPDVLAPVAPDTNDIGAYLPYSPLHHLLLAEISPLVMTSGNLADEPIAIDETGLAPVLEAVADAALIHDRPIARRCDDSVLKIAGGQRLFIRRSRGFVPDPIRLPVEGPPVLACGAELKSTICVTRSENAFMSQHLGDLDDYRAYRFFREAIADFTGLLQARPEIIAHDLHPDYLSTRFALSGDLAPARTIGVQHHHAHIAACLAEHRLTAPAIGVALDGAGYGPDGSIWGGELLVADLRSYRRAAHFQNYPLPGGAEAIRCPARMAFSYLRQGATPCPVAKIAELLPDLTAEEIAALEAMIAAKINSPLTSSAGRLFDAVAALLGIGAPVTYEGQAAIRLQALADTTVADVYPFEIDQRADPLIVSFAPTIGAIVADLRAGADRRRMAGMFHNTVAAAVGGACAAIRVKEGLETVALSGGVFQNDLLLERVTSGLRAAGFQVYSHQLVPPNDGGIALGQAAVALAQFAVRDGKKQTKKD